MKKKKKSYWLSFSYQEVNQGVCCVKATSKKKAKEKSDKLGLTPKNDDVLCSRIPYLESGMKINTFYSLKDMMNIGYIPVRTEACVCPDCMEKLLSGDL